jgi:hypothetical protein
MDKKMPTDLLGEDAVRRIIDPLNRLRDIRSRSSRASADEDIL